MEQSFFKTSSGRTFIMLDPRTKLLMLITTSTLMHSTGNDGIMNIIKPIISVIPFLLLFSEKRYRTAGKYLLLYIVCFGIERIAMTASGGLLPFLIMASCSIMTRFAPGIMTGAFLLSTTSVSEFISAMKRMYMPDKITIPLSVIFRFFPTVAEESSSISDAMRMRGIKFGSKNPLHLIEYRIIPLMISIVKIGDELSAAALTRGLGSPKKRTNICKIGFHMQDVFVIAVCIFCFAAYFLRSRIVF